MNMILGQTKRQPKNTLRQVFENTNSINKSEGNGFKCNSALVEMHNNSDAKYDAIFIKYTHEEIKII